LAELFFNAYTCGQSPGLSLVIAHILCSSKKVMWERLD